MRCRALIHSIHSQVPETIERLDRRVRVAISLDSHLDLSLGGDDDVYPPELLAIARRTSAHSEIQRILGSNATHGSKLIIAIPRVMLTAHALDLESSLPARLRVKDESESVTSVVDFLRNERKVEVVASPPRSLEELLGYLGGTRDWVLDIDVDCMEEMQDECYTRIIDPEPGTLQSMDRVIEFIAASRPETITLSEAKTSAIRSRDSNFSCLLDRLKDLHYSIEEVNVVSSDDEIVRGIDVCYEFYRSVSKRLLVKHRGEMMKGDLEGFRRDEMVEGRKFFGSRGYRYSSSSSRTRT